MAVDMKKMKQKYNDNKKGGDFWTPPEGDTLVYIHPQCRPNDEFEPTSGLNYVPVVVHYQVGKSKSMVVSLDPETNPIVNHPFVKAFLKKKGIKLTGECPLSKALAKGELDEEEAAEAKAQTRYLWGLTPLKHRSKPSEEWRELRDTPKVGMLGKTLYDAIMEVFFENGDISDPNAAILVKITREGKGKNDTKYKATADAASLKKPVKLPKELQLQLKKVLAEGGDCDLFKIVANMVKSPSEVKALINNVKVDDSDDDDEDEDDEAEVDADEADTDDDADDEADESDDEDADDSDDEADDEEADDEEDSDDEADEDDDAGDSDDEEDSDDEDEADDEDDEAEVEAQPVNKGDKVKPKEKAKAKAKSDDDGGLDDLDKELDRLSNKKKSGKGAGAEV